MSDIVPDLIFQLLSQACSLIMVNEWIIMPLELSRTLFWPDIKHSSFLLFVYPFIQRLSFFVCLSFAFEIFLLKYLAVVKFKRVLPLNEDFFAFFILLSNLTLACILSIISWYSQFGSNYMVKFAGWPQYLANRSPISGFFTNVIVLTFLIFLIFASATVSLEKKKFQAEVDNSNQLNNISRNQDVMGTGITFALATIFTINVVVAEITKFNYPILSYLNHSTNSLLSCPFLIYLKSPKLKVFVRNIM